MFGGLHHAQKLLWLACGKARVNQALLARALRLGGDMGRAIVNSTWGQDMEMSAAHIHLQAVAGRLHGRGGLGMDRALRGSLCHYQGLLTLFAAGLDPAAASLLGHNLFHIGALLGLDGVPKIMSAYRQLAWRESRQGWLPIDLTFSCDSSVVVQGSRCERARDALFDSMRGPALAGYQAEAFARAARRFAGGWMSNAKGAPAWLEARGCAVPSRSELEAIGSVGTPGGGHAFAEFMLGMEPVWARALRAELGQAAAQATEQARAARLTRSL